MTPDSVTDRILRLPDGRKLGFRVWGDPAGAPLLFLHGTPGSRLEFALGHEAGKALGVALIAPDRWGYGLTDAPPSPSLAAFAEDMAALIDHLGYQRVAVGGVSGGAPYASAVACRLPERVTALALVSPVGPIAGAAAWPAAMPPFQRFAFTVLPGWPHVISSVFKIFRLSLVRTPRLAGHLATLRGCPPDKALIFRPDIGGYLLPSFREGLRPGMIGPITDLRLFSQPWGLNLEAIASPTRLWIGTADRTVPLGAARTLASAISRCQMIELSDEGHLWVAGNARQVLEWIGSTAHETAR